MKYDPIDHTLPDMTRLELDKNGLAPKPKDPLDVAVKLTEGQLYEIYGLQFRAGRNFCLYSGGAEVDSDPHILLPKIKSGGAFLVFNRSPWDIAVDVRGLPDTPAKPSQDTEDARDAEAALEEFHEQGGKPLDQVKEEMGLDFIHPLDRGEDLWRFVKCTSDFVVYELSGHQGPYGSVEREFVMKPDWRGARAACPEAFGGKVESLNAKLFSTQEEWESVMKDWPKVSFWEPENVRRLEIIRTYLLSEGE